MNPGWEMGVMDQYGNTIAGTVPASLTKAPVDVTVWHTEDVLHPWAQTQHCRWLQGRTPTY